MCSFGSRILPRPGDSHLRYVGGETRVVSFLWAAASLATLVAVLAKVAQAIFALGLRRPSLKYKVPQDGLDSLIFISSGVLLRVRLSSADCGALLRVRLGFDDRGEFLCGDMGGLHNSWFEAPVLYLEHKPRTRPPQGARRDRFRRCRIRLRPPPRHRLRRLQGRLPRVRYHAIALTKAVRVLCSTVRPGPRPEPPDAAVRCAVRVSDYVLLFALVARAEQTTKGHFAKACELTLVSHLPVHGGFVKDAETYMYTLTNCSTQGLNGNGYGFAQVIRGLLSIVVKKIQLGLECGANGVLLNSATSDEERGLLYAVEVPKLVTPIWIPVVAFVGMLSRYINSHLTHLVAKGKSSPYMQFAMLGSTGQIRPSPWPSFCVNHVGKSMSVEPVVCNREVQALGGCQMNLQFQVSCSQADSV